MLLAVVLRSMAWRLQPRWGEAELPRAAAQWLGLVSQCSTSTDPTRPRLSNRSCPFALAHFHALLTLLPSHQIRQATWTAPRSMPRTPSGRRTSPLTTCAWGLAWMRWSAGWTSRPRCRWVLSWVLVRWGVWAWQAPAALTSVRPNSGTSYLVLLTLLQVINKSMAGIVKNLGAALKANNLEKVASTMDEVGGCSGGGWRVWGARGEAALKANPAEVASTIDEVGGWDVSRSWVGWGGVALKANNLDEVGNRAEGWITGLPGGLAGAVLAATQYDVEALPCNAALQPSCAPPPAFLPAV